MSQSNPTNQQDLSDGSVYLQQAPFLSHQEYLAGLALRVAAVPAEWIRENVRSAFGRVPFPRRDGYPDYVERQPTIEGVLALGHSYRDNRYSLSGGPAGWQGSSRNVNEQVW